VLLGGGVEQQHQREESLQHALAVRGIVAVTEEPVHGGVGGVLRIHGGVVQEALREVLAQLRLVVRVELHSVTCGGGHTHAAGGSQRQHGVHPQPQPERLVRGQQQLHRALLSVSRGARSDECASAMGWESRTSWTTCVLKHGAVCSVERSAPTRMAMSSRSVASLRKVRRPASTACSTLSMLFTSPCVSCVHSRHSIPRSAATIRRCLAWPCARHPPPAQEERAQPTRSWRTEPHCRRVGIPCCSEHTALLLQPNSPLLVVTWKPPRP
jgi:hypothetical protein